MKVFVISETPITPEPPIPVDSAVIAGFDAISHGASGFQVAFVDRTLAVPLLRKDDQILIWIVGKEEDRMCLSRIGPVSTKFGVEFEEQRILDKSTICFGPITIAPSEAQGFLMAIFHAIGISGNDLCSYHVYEHLGAPDYII